MGDICQKKDVFERMNFLYQASQMISKVDTVGAALYGNTMVNCARKSVIRMEPDLKRSICKNCHCPLIPGETVQIRLISKPEKAVKFTCLLCKTARKFPTRRGYELWVNQPKSIVKIFDYTPHKAHSMSEQNQPP